ncbi:hypothetical protein KCTC32516_00667 [Polaribacter huanghezhanensis]|uniref:DUF6973 domain-containing protein n=1 Tax=Polaribacter huanghezhanensis TaxID=1354726 RepID=UPI002648DC5C|nr:hypothetical protein [Polaribacter huanghezhanensis]WKD85327.1 hypothetical protein KCTC32516_00667 [Polaribacter huanghezhanensis]
MKKVLIFYCVLFSLQGFSQTDWQAFKKLSCAEKTWIIFHPFKAKKAFKISKEAQRVSDSIAKTPLLDGDKRSGQVDAFRHAYWMARLHQEIGKNAALKLGKAHEKSNYQQYKKGQLEYGEVPDKISSEMDLFNNTVGVTYTEKGIPYPKNGLIYRIVNGILAGNYKVIKKDKKRNYVTCDDQIISQKDLKGKWKNEKCLINSN